MKSDLQACITLDLEADHAGYAPEAYDTWQKSKIEKLFHLLEKHGVRLTIFVSANTLEKRPEIIKLFIRDDWEFHLHSFSHNLKNPDSQEEILRGKKAFKSFFGKPPLGYRAPGGRISKKGWRRLEKQGFLFSASIIPSFWPKPNYFFFPNRPFKPLGYKLLEVPFSTISPLRLVISLSWIKLFGWNFYRFLFKFFPLPKILVFGLHLHDLQITPSYRQLAPFWKLIYSRNQKSGLAILDKFLSLITNKGYRFSLMRTVVNNYQT